MFITFFLINNYIYWFTSWKFGQRARWHEASCNNCFAYSCLSSWFWNTYRVLAFYRTSDLQPKMNAKSWVLLLVNQCPIIFIIWPFNLPRFEKAIIIPRSWVRFQRVSSQSDFLIFEIHKERTFFYCWLRSTNSSSHVSPDQWDLSRCPALFPMSLQA